MEMKKEIRQQEMMKVMIKVKGKNRCSDPPGVGLIPGMI